MKYSNDFTAKKGLYPKLKYILKNIPNEYHFGTKHPHPCRPPGGIYNVATTEFLTSLLKAIKKYETYQPEHGDEGDYFDDLLDLIGKCIGHICSFYDECLLLLISISKPSSQNPVMASEWLKINGYQSGSEFVGFCYEAIKLWQDINNRLKHNNQKINYLIATRGNLHIESFFVEGYSPDDSLGPDPTFHNKANGMSQAFSFKKAFNQLFLTFLYISDKLLIVIRHHLKKNYNHDLMEKIIITETDDGLIREVWERLSAFDYIYFHDEYRIKYTRIEKMNETYRISYPHKDILVAPGIYQIKTKLNSDGFTRKFQLPTFR